MLITTVEKKSLIEEDSMAKLQPRLDRMRERFEATAPPEALTVMHRATEDLISSGAAAAALGEGAAIPRFSLPNQANETVSLDNLLARGPVVATIFRGPW